jgi:hypothetical protein
VNEDGSEKTTHTGVAIDVTGSATVGAGQVFARLDEQLEVVVICRSDRAFTLARRAHFLRSAFVFFVERIEHGTSCLWTTLSMCLVFMVVNNHN